MKSVLGILTPFVFVFVMFSYMLLTIAYWNARLWYYLANRLGNYFDVIEPDEAIERMRSIIDE